MEIKIGQLWKLVDTEKIYNSGYQDDIFIILAEDVPLTDNIQTWIIGCFWWSGKPIDDLGWGGARQQTLIENEIREIGELIGYLPDMLKKQESTEF